MHFSTAHYPNNPLGTRHAILNDNRETVGYGYDHVMATQIAAALNAAEARKTEPDGYGFEVIAFWSRANGAGPHTCRVSTFSDAMLTALDQVKSWPVYHVSIAPAVSRDSQLHWAMP